MDVNEVVDPIDELIKARMEASRDVPDGPGQLDVLEAERRCRQLREELSEALCRGSVEG